MTAPRTLIIDDEAPARRMVRDAIAALTDPSAIEVVGTCVNGLEAVAALAEAAQSGPVIDLAFLDVQMPGLNGFEVLDAVRARGLPLPRVIFSTAFDQHAVRAFEVAAIDYLLKPFTQARFAEAVARVVGSGDACAGESEAERIAAAVRAALGGTVPRYPDRLLVGTGGLFTPVEVAQIRWIEAAGDYARLHTAGRTYLASQGIGALEERLDPAQFARVHRSALVNLAALRALERDGSGGFTARLEGGDTIRVSRTYADAIRAMMA